MRCPTISDARGTDRNNPRHPGFHKTATIDYAIVLAGEIYAMMDEGEVLLKAGDVLIQRGTNHAWSNRTAEPAVVAFGGADRRRAGVEKTWANRGQHPARIVT